MLVQSLSGVRGIFGKSLTIDVASKYCAAYFSIQKPKRIVIGMDTRHSGPAIKAAMISAISCEVIDVGILPTPAIQNAVRHFKADGGIIITASHNPMEWNGFKFLRKDGSVLYENEMEKVITQYQKFSSKAHSIVKKTIALQKRGEALTAYSAFIHSILGKRAIESIKKQNLSIVIDPNGGTGTVAKEILESCGIKTIALHMDHGEFSRQIEPTEESLAYLVPKIKLHKAVFAAGFDCDADRVEIILPNKKMLSGNEMIALASKHILQSSRSPKKEIIVINSATSTIVQQIAKTYNAKVIEVEVGEANVVEAMKKNRSKIGGEGSSSGVIVAPATSRDGILGVLLMAALLSESKNPLTSLIDTLPKSCYLKEKISVMHSVVPAIKKQVAAYYRPKAMKLSFNLNGAVKVWLTNRSFVWLRDSKTEEGILRVIVDAPTNKEATFLMQEVLSVIKKQP